MQRHYKIVLFIIFSVAYFTPVSSFAQEERVYQGCSGGMMLHAGWLGGKHTDYPYNPQGATLGIGGAMRVNLWKHLRIGGEGYVSNMPMGMTDAREVLQKGSYIRNGWGGLLVDACWRMEKLWPYIGAGVGGGAKRSLFIADGSQNDWSTEGSAIFHKEGYFYACPFVGMDIVLTKAIHLSCKVDCMMSFHRREMLTPIGPRVYIGFMFCH